MFRSVLSTIPAQILAICAIAAATMLMPAATATEARIAAKELRENRLPAKRNALEGIPNAATHPPVEMDREPIAR